MYRSSALDELNQRIAYLGAARSERQAVAIELQKAHNDRDRLRRILHQHDELLRRLQREVLSLASAGPLIRFMGGQQRSADLRELRRRMRSTQRERMHVQVALEATLHRLNELKRRLDAWAEIDRQYADALAEKESWLKAHDDASASMLMTIAAKVERLSERLDLVNAAIEAGEQASAALDAALFSLGGVRAWTRRALYLSDPADTTEPALLPVRHRHIQAVFHHARAVKSILGELGRACHALMTSDWELTPFVHKTDAYAEQVWLRLVGDCEREVKIAKTADFLAEVRGFAVKLTRILVQLRQSLRSEIKQAKAHRLAVLEQSL